MPIQPSLPMESINEDIFATVLKMMNCSSHFPRHIIHCYESCDFVLVILGEFQEFAFHYFLCNIHKVIGNQN
jgi:hypothetical protein